MKGMIMKYVNLLLILFFLLIPLRARARLLWSMSRAKQYVMGMKGKKEQAHEKSR